MKHYDLHQHLAELFPVPHPCDLRPTHLFLQLKNTVENSFGGRRASWDVDVNRNDSVDASNHTIAIVVVPSTVGAASHADDPSRLRHLIVTLSQGRTHLVRHRPGHNHHIGLAGRGPEDDAEAVLIIPRHRNVHHLDGAACQSETQRP